MPVIRTKNAVLIIGTAIGLAAALGSACAQVSDLTPMRMAQFRGGGGGGGGGDAISNQDDEREKKKREEEKRKREHTPPPGGGAHGGPGGPGASGGPGGFGASGGGGGRHSAPPERGQPDQLAPHGRKGGGQGEGNSDMYRRDNPRSHPGTADTPPQGEDRRGRQFQPSGRSDGSIGKPIGQREPDNFDAKKRDEDLHKGHGDDRRSKPPQPSGGAAGSGGSIGKPVGQREPDGLDAKKRDEDLHKGHADDRRSKPPQPSGGTTGSGGSIGKPIGQREPDGLDAKKRDEDLHKGHADDRRGRPTPPSGAADSTGSLSGKPLERKQPDHSGPGQHGGMFDRNGRPPRGDDDERDGKPGRADAPILPKPSPVELDARRKERAGFSHGHLGDISKQRHERKDESGRTVITEPGNRQIIREGGRSFIHHDESERLRHGGRDFREERGPRGERRHYFTRPDGVVVISIMSEDGRLIRRMRRERDGREVIIINNDSERWHRHRGHRVGGFGFSVDLAPPVIRIPRERYYVDAESANEDDVYEALSAPPVEDVEADYTLDEIRYSKPLRDRMRTVNLSTINFEFGSWEVTNDQIGRLDVVARAMRRILRRNPDEVFLVGGHTDAVGSDEDNLSLSDRRAESVARVLTDEYGIPAENLVTQGYGEQQLLIESQDAERRNRRVEFQRITPMLARH